MTQQASTHLETRIRPQFYLDSVALMRMSRTLTAIDGVHDAAMMMGTPANLEIMTNAGLLESRGVPDNDAGIGPGDLVLTVRADSQATAVNALDEAEQLLAQPQQVGKSRHWQPRSIRSAVENQADANIALISVPGAFAASEARKAIRRGLHTMIFSDNVPLQSEVLLKQEARELGVLVMGPDCGTCVINGVPLAFANCLPRGDIGIVGASGTGIQEVSCLLAGMGKGISHAIGVGGRDMTQVVGGISTLMALDALDNDEATQHIIVICKPPAPEVANAVIERIAASAKTFTVCFIGGQADVLPANAHGVGTLKDAAEYAARQSADTNGFASAIISNVGTTEDTTQTSTTRNVPAQGTLIRGLFCGGTLCAEAQVVCLAAGLTISSNAAIPGVANELSSASHTLIDLGADEYTQGKPHPMIDPAVRDQHLCEALNDGQCAVLLVDVVLGYGAHADPAGQLVRSLPDGYAAKNTQIIASVTGTEEDPQVRSRQILTLQNAGIQVADSNADAASMAVAYVQ